MNKDYYYYYYYYYYIRAFCYADDISILSPTVSGLQNMPKICERYAHKFKIHFNASKVNYYVLIQVFVQKVKI